MCIYKSNDKGYIGNSTKIKRKNGTYYFKCPDIPSRYGNLEYKISFYAFSPMIRPIPRGLKIVNINKYGLSYLLDPFITREENVQFIAWTKNVPGTIPLYIYTKNDGNIIASLTKINYHIEPEIVYVLDASSIKINKNTGEPIINFIPIDGRCIPNKKGTSLSKCFLTVDENIKKDDILNHNPSLLNRLLIEDEINEYSKYKLCPFKMTMIISLIVSIIIIKLIISKINNDKYKT